MIATINAEKKTLTVELPLEALTPSKSGKSRLVATTRGNKPSNLVMDGKTVVVSVNAYVPI